MLSKHYLPKNYVAETLFAEMKINQIRQLWEIYLFTYNVFILY
jgi:hypothetical protein